MSYHQQLLERGTYWVTGKLMGLKPRSYEGTKKKKVRNPKRFLTQYPDRESNSELSFRRALLYPFNYQGNIFGCKVTKKFLKVKK